MNIDEIIQNKIKLIEERTGDKVFIEERSDIGVNADACIDFNYWTETDMRTLPRILHKPSVDRVHILHEVIHLEKFFLEGYQIIAHCNRPDPWKKEFVSSIEKKFKNVPEDYVAHKVIGEYGFNPIKETWFQSKLSTIDLDLAVQLVNARIFSEFLPERRKWAADLWERIRREKHYIYSMSKNVVHTLTSIDYKNKDSYNSHLAQIIKIFAPQYCRVIYPSFLLKIKGQWTFKP